MRDKAILLCFVLVALLACKKDRFAGKYRGDAVVVTMKKSKFGFAPESTQSFPGVEVEVTGNSGKDFFLHLTFEDGGPLENCKLVLHNDPLEPDATVLSSSLDIPENKTHTCDIKYVGGKRRVHFRTGIVYLLTNGNKISMTFDTLEPSSDVQFDFKYDGKRK